MEDGEMPDETTTGQVPDENTQPSETDEQNTDRTPADDEFDRDRAMATIKSLRAFERNAKKQLKELDDLRAKVQAREDAEKSELDLAKEAAQTAAQERDAALRTANERLVRAEVKSLCASDELQIVDADAAYALMSHDDVSIDDTGNVQGVTDALKALVAAKPWLKKSEQKTNGVPPTPPADGSTQKQSFAEAYLRTKRR